MGSGGSGRQIPGLRNTKCIRGSHTWARRPKDLKPDSCPEGVEVDATGRWGEGESAIPGEICSPARGLVSSRDEMRGEQKSAEGIVAMGVRGEGPNVMSGLRTETSMDEIGADRRAGMPKDSRKVAGGTGEKKERERQATTAGTEETQPEGMGLLEEVLRRENMLSAFRRVRSNKGAPGIDGMTVEQLGDYLKVEWPRIREELFKGTYRPMPVRHVEISKPNGKGMRPLGIPTVLDRMIQQAILQVLTPIFDPHFSDSSYGYRPGRCSQDAVKAAQ